MFEQPPVVHTVPLPSMHNMMAEFGACIAASPVVHTRKAQLTMVSLCAQDM